MASKTWRMYLPFTNALTEYVCYKKNSLNVNLNCLFSILPWSLLYDLIPAQYIIFLPHYRISTWSVVNILCAVHFMHLWIWLKIFTFTDYKWSWDSSVGIVVGYGLDGLGSIPGSARFFSYPQHPDQFWGPPSLLSNLQGALPLGIKWQEHKLTTHLHLVLRSRKVELYLHSPKCLHGIVLN
jgi:hypothetical protein